MNGRTRTRGCRDGHPDYRGYRIEAEAVVTSLRWNATVTIRRIRSRDPSHVDMVTCLKLTPELAESAGEICAKRWIDLQAMEGT